MTSYKSIFAAIAAVTLVAACAKKEEAPAPEADVSLEVKTEAPPPAVEVVVPVDSSASDANSADAEQSGGDKVSQSEPPPANN